MTHLKESPNSNFKITMINTFQKVVNKNDAFCQRSGISKYKSNGNFINKMAIKIDGLISLKAG